MLDITPNTILQGDALQVLSTLPDCSVQCCITSPPYYALRDYGVDGQIGLEDSPAEYVNKLVAVFREVRRVLKDNGTCWVNIGDSYAHDDKWGGSTGGKHVQSLHGTNATRERRQTGFKHKDLMMMPARLAIALCDDGWYLRSDIIWNKPTAMPESVTDRPTKAHEYLFLLAKNEHYFYDAKSIAEPAVSTHSSGNGFKRDARLSYLNPDGTARGNDQQWQVTPERNKRSVWSINTQPYPAAHFATMPPKLVEPCILAGTSPKACEHCGAVWSRVIVPTGHINKREAAHAPFSSPTKTDSTGWAPTRQATDTWTPTCTCANNTGSGKCVVLDPFMGAGTTALVALQHNRRFLGIELNPDYIELAHKRISTIQPDIWSQIDIPNMEEAV